MKKKIIIQLKKDKSKVKIGPPESMSKSKKNTVIQKKMIKNYGADAVRWFIFQIVLQKKIFNGHNNGVSSANKFLQKIWNL